MAPPDFGGGYAGRLWGLMMVLGLVSLTGCGPDSVYAETREVNAESGWYAADVQSFQFAIDDTLQKHEFFIDLRHNQTYPFSNLYLFVDYTFPNGRSRQDTILCELADSRGNWLGTGSGPIVDHRIGVQTQTAFPLMGNYGVTIAHAMRENPLPGILDVGFRLEKSPE